MSKDAVATMGGILPEDVGGRDAVHVAVVAVTAGGDIGLYPGQDAGIVGATDSGEPIAAAKAPKMTGIVDPFLKERVYPGARFWLYLYPRTITGLSHRWTHPDFPDAGPGEVYAPPSAKLSSEKWIRDYAEKFGDNYEDLMAGADAWVNSTGWGEYYYGPSDGNGMRGTYEGESTDPEFWEHYERVRGVVVPANKRESFFTCSC